MDVKLSIPKSRYANCNAVREMMATLAVHMAGSTEWQVHKCIDGECRVVLEQMLEAVDHINEDDKPFARKVS